MSNRPIAFGEITYLPEHAGFNGSDRGYLAGRCLLDALEFLRIDPKWSARFAQLVNAHAIRLCWLCLDDLKHDAFKKRIRGEIDEVRDSILEGSQTGVCVFGDDFWDWAYILEALLTVPTEPNDKRKAEAIKGHLQTFFDKVEDRVEGGLSVKSSGEWFGPATPTAAYRLLHGYGKQVGNRWAVNRCLNRLKKQALQPILGGDNKYTYLGRDVQPMYHHWHMGQVVAQFPKDSKKYEKDLFDLDAIKKHVVEKSERAYALARVYQGAAALKEDDICGRVIDMLCEECENFRRPLGTGMMADQMKASLNVLEALWPTLNETDHNKVRLMLDSLLGAHRRANRVGILVAIKRERDACIEAFKTDGASIKHNDVIEIDHSDYQAVIVEGKALIEATHATSNLIRMHGVTRVIMVGIAGSLGTENDKDQCVGPKIGDVVIATSISAYHIREKVRVRVTDAPVPWKKTKWSVFPVDLELFEHGHRAKMAKKKRDYVVHEGLIVTGNGIKDHPDEKAKVRNMWPGGLAVAEEGVAAALQCLLDHVPYLEIRGISDLAEGDKGKQKQDKEKEEKDQKLAARNAMEIAVEVVQSLASTGRQSQVP